MRTLVSLAGRARAADLDQLVDGVPAVLGDRAVGLDLDRPTAGRVVVDLDRAVPDSAGPVDRDRPHPAGGVVLEPARHGRADLTGR